MNARPVPHPPPLWTRFGAGTPLGGAAEFLFRRIGSRLRSSPWLTRRLFQVDVEAQNRRTHWDMALLAIRGPVLGAVTPGARVLEVGTGDLGLLSLHVARHRPDARVMAVDISGPFVENARRMAQRNGLHVEFLVSDLFASVEGVFDVIVSVLPYVPRAWGAASARHSRFPEPDSVWDGGADGLDVVRRFLQDAPRHLAPTGKVLLATSDFFHPPEAVRAELGDYQITEVHRLALNPTRLWVLEQTMRKVDRSGRSP